METRAFLPKVIMKYFMMLVGLSSRYGSIFLLFPVTIIKITPMFSVVILNSYDSTTENCQSFCIPVILIICKKKIVFNISGPPKYLLGLSKFRKLKKVKVKLSVHSMKA